MATRHSARIAALPPVTYTFHDTSRTPDIEIEQQLKRKRKARSSDRTGDEPKMPMTKAAEQSKRSKKVELSLPPAASCQGTCINDDALQDLCLDIISHHLCANFASTDCGGEIGGSSSSSGSTSSAPAPARVMLDAARLAAKLALVGSSAFTRMSMDLCDALVDPGCKAAREKALASDARKRKKWESEREKLTGSKSAVGKAQVKRLTDKLAKQPLSPRRCPVRPPARRLLQEEQARRRAEKRRDDLKRERGRRRAQVDEKLKDLGLNLDQAQRTLEDNYGGEWHSYDDSDDEEDFDFDNYYQDLSRPKNQPGDKLKSYLKAKQNVNFEAVVQELADAKARVTRRAELRTALEALGCQLRNDSRLCAAYIRWGEGDPNDIAITMREMTFYFEETNYEQCREECADELWEHKGYMSQSLSEEASDNGKDMAFLQWLERFNSPEEAAAHPTLPDSLRKRVNSEWQHLPKALKRAKGKAQAIAAAGPSQPTAAQSGSQAAAVQSEPTAAAAQHRPAQVATTGGAAGPGAAQQAPANSGASQLALIEPALAAPAAAQPAAAQPAATESGAA